MELNVEDEGRYQPATFIGFGYVRDSLSKSFCGRRFDDRIVKSREVENLRTSQEWELVS